MSENKEIKSEVIVGEFERSRLLSSVVRVVIQLTGLKQEFPREPIDWNMSGYELEQITINQRGVGRISIDSLYTPKDLEYLEPKIVSKRDSHIIIEEMDDDYPALSENYEIVWEKNSGDDDE